MQNAWNEIVVFFRTMEQDGVYYGLGLFAVLFCLIYESADKKKNIAVAVLSCVVVLLLCNPVTIWLYEKVFGQGETLSVLTMAIPLLPFLSYVGAEFFVTVSKNRNRYEKGFMAVVLLLVIMAAGTIVPWSESEDLAKRTQISYGKEDDMIVSVQDAASELITAGQEPLLVGPKEVMESIRRYDPRICLAYGRDLWQADALMYLHESYPEEKIILCQRMEAVDANIAETVELALAQGCNLIVCREPLTETFMEYHHLELYAQEDDLYLYVR